MEIKKLSREHIEPIIEIASEQFGYSYLTKEILEQNLIHPNIHGSVIIVDQLVVGFSTYKIVRNIDMYEALLVKNESVEKFLRTYPTIGYRMQTALLPKYVNKGLGYKLVEYGNEFLSNKTDAIVSLTWKSNSEFQIAKILEMQNFSVISEFDNYWYQDSIQKHYNCKICGHPPCKCKAILYAKF